MARRYIEPDRPRVNRIGMGSSRGMNALGGLGEGISDLSRAYLNHIIERRDKEKDEQVGLSKTLQQDIKSDPESSLRTLDAAKQNPLSQGMNIDQMLPKPDVRLGPLSNDIAKAKDVNELPDVTGRAYRALTPKEAAPTFGQTAQNGGTDGEDPTLPSTQFGPTSPPSIQHLLAQAAARKSAIDNEVISKRSDAQKTAEATAYGTHTGELRAKNENFPTELQQDADKGWTQLPIETEKTRAGEAAKLGEELSPTTTTAKATQAGAVKKSEMQAEAPFMEARARAAAMVERANHIANRDYDLSHPVVSAQVKNREASAKDAMQLIGENTQLLDAMDKAGMMGPLKSRIAKFATTDVKGESLVRSLFGGDTHAADAMGKDAFPNEPNKAQLAAQYFAQMSYLQSLAAMVHGGQRGASSPMMLQRFEKIIGSTGDTGIVKSELTAINNLMKIYSHNGEAPDLMVIPQAGPPGLQDGEQGPQLPASSAAAKLKALREQKE